MFRRTNTKFLNITNVFRDSNEAHTHVISDIGVGIGIGAIRIPIPTPILTQRL